MKTEEAKQVQRVYLDIKNRFEVVSQRFIFAVINNDYNGNGTLFIVVSNPINL